MVHIIIEVLMRTCICLILLTTVSSFIDTLSVSWVYYSEQPAVSLTSYQYRVFTTANSQQFHWNPISTTCLLQWTVNSFIDTLLVPRVYYSEQPANSLTPYQYHVFTTANSQQFHWHPINTANSQQFHWYPINTACLLQRIASSFFDTLSIPRVYYSEQPAVILPPYQYRVFYTTANSQQFHWHPTNTTCLLQRTASSFIDTQSVPRVYYSKQPSI